MEDVLHALFAPVGMTPARDLNLAEQANSALNHTSFLNLVAAAVAALLLSLRHWSPKRSEAADHRP